MEKPFFTSGEVAAKLELPRWQLLYLIERGDLPAPVNAVPGRRLFTQHDIRQIKKALELRQPEPEPLRSATAKRANARRGRKRRRKEHK